MSVAPFGAAFFALAGCILLAPAPAGAQQSQPAESRPVAPARLQDPVDFDRYSPGASRRAFQMCDGNADDRVSILEAQRALLGLGTVQDVSPFRRIDTNADGFLEWDEFDRRLRDLIENGGTLRVRPLREVPATTAATNEPPMVGAILKALDSDHDQELDAREAITLMRAAATANLAADLASWDRDNSGRLSRAEIAALIAASQALLPRPPSRLPPGLAQSDTDGDESLSPRELEAALRRIDPGLARWAPKVLADADTNRNGALGRSELLPYAPPTR
jgi:Ca2+-binding EF-hand superfamily protein